MIIRNAFAVPRQVGQSDHGGVGSIEHCRVFNPEDFRSDWNSVSYDVLPPGTSIGVHKQTKEEIYFILEGTGSAAVSGEEREVGPGDMVLAMRGDTHGIKNHSSQTLKMVAISVRVQGASA